MDKQMNNNKGVINRLQHRVGKEKFEQLYSATNGLHYRTIKVQYNQQLKELFTLSQYAGFDGLLFHYGFDPLSKCISYLIGLGKVSNNDWTAHPIPNVVGPNDGYYEITNSSLALVARSTSEFDTLKKQYWCNILRATNPAGPFNPISGDLDHPRMVIHEKDELVAFDKEYENFDDPYLYVNHGASEVRRHTPMFRFGNDDNLFPIDNVDYRAQYGMNERYRMKGFNIGQLCPPDCGTIVSIAPDCSV
jgi:hypothetical protein